MAFDASRRIVLLLHDGELADVRALVERIGAQVVESQTGVSAAPAFDVAIATPRRVRELGRVGGNARSVRIAVLDRDARTLRALLRRSGMDLIVSRPVHPMALRLLLLHALYRGPERRTRRVAVGAPVRFRALLYSRSAILADLSERGCLLVARRAAAPGRRVTVYVPDVGSPGREFAVSGRVVRAARPPPGLGGAAFGVEFDGMAPRARVRLREAVVAHLEGPAVLPGAAPASSAPAKPEAAPPEREAPAPALEAEGEDCAEAPALECDPISEKPEPEPAADAGRDDVAAWADEVALAERRRVPRGSYAGRRVVALGEEAARVLIGRDLSPGGMRVDRNSRLELGQHLRIALHVSPGEAPVVVDAEVARDDGALGLVLRFRELPEPVVRYLTKMVDALPVLDAGGSSAERVVVSEILEDEER